MKRKVLTILAVLICMIGQTFAVSAESIFDVKMDYYTVGYNFHNSGKMKWNWPGGGAGYEIVNDEGMDCIKFKYSLIGGVNNTPGWINISPLNATGNIIVSGSFKVNNYPSGADFEPILFGDSNTVSRSELKWYGIRTVYIDNGEVRAIGSKMPGSTQETMIADSYDKICDFKSDTWYQLSLYLNVDGDSSTPDSYYYSLYDGENTYTGGPYALGYAAAPWITTSFQLTKIDYVQFATNYRKFNETEDAPGLTIGDWKVDYVPPLRVENISITDGEEEVPVNSEIVVTFSESINDDTLSDIKIEKVNNEEKVEYIYSLDDEKMVVTLKPQFNYNTSYLLKIPKSVTNKMAVGMEKDVKLSFSTEKRPKAVRVSDPVLTGKLISGEEVSIDAVVTNIGSNDRQPICLISSLCRSDNDTVIKMDCAQTFLGTGKSETLNIRFKIPEGYATDELYVKTLIWDSFSDMISMMDVTKLK